MSKAKQNWEIGNIVKIGFVAGLEVVKKISTPRDADIYVLWQAANNRFYSFQPHNGLCRHNTLNEALRAS